MYGVFNKSINQLQNKKISKCVGSVRQSLHFAKSVGGLMLLTFGIFGAAGCSPSSKSAAVKLVGDVQHIFSTRPQNSTQFIGVMKLKSPALLAAASRSNGKTVLDPDLVRQVQAEHDQAVKDMQAISSEIQILSHYRLVLNGIGFVAPIEVLDKLKGMSNVIVIERAGQFARPEVVDSAQVKVAVQQWAKNSVDFIGSSEAHALGFRGQGMKIGVIDTGIDYTHLMLGGAGTVDAYKAIDPNKPTPAFPNAKVVGGVDLVGTKYDSASPDFKNHIPLPDSNPLDEAGHGSHVAGTVAGIGDGTNTYSGVAPDAMLYGIKVFGADGSTSDQVVIQALEYSVDPNGDLKLDDQLDVVNLSLGSGYGSPHILYGEAIKNLVRGGTVAAISAGNSGAQDFIVGAPGTADDAISVAASIDNMTHNTEFKAANFVNAAGKESLVEAIEGSLSKPIAEAGNVHGKLVPAGLAAEDFSAELKAQLVGNVALITRGAVNFSEKIRRASEAGAIGVVVVNNQDGAPLAMGGDGKYPIPAIMVTKDFGKIIFEDLKAGDVTIYFQTPKTIFKPELIDTLTGFSSKGPRSEDALIKPEISAPGQQVVSADYGKGNVGVKLSGTSMASPHIAGVLALLKQAHPDLTPFELKSLLMGRAKTIFSAPGKVYPVSQQGAGRVQIVDSIHGTLVADTIGFSLGITAVETRKTINRAFSLKSIAGMDQSLSFKWSGHQALGLILPSDITLKAGASQALQVSFVIDAAKMKQQIEELDGFLLVLKGGVEVHRIPVLALAQKVSQVGGVSLVVKATSPADGNQAVTELKVTNNGKNAGDMLPFNLLGIDTRKADSNPKDSSHNRSCDMQTAGYRLVQRTVDGESKLFLQVAVKLFEAVTTWNQCEVNVQIDIDGDQLPDQEIAGVPMDRLPGLTGTKFVSLLLDARKARAIRKEFEGKISEGDDKVKENYSDAVVDSANMTAFNISTVAIVEADVSQLDLRPTGELAIKVSTTHVDASAVEVDDYLDRDFREWRSIGTDPTTTGFFGLPESISLNAGESKTLSFTKGQSSDELLLLFPQNRSVVGAPLIDTHSQVIQAVYAP